jgi:hypothetical protein
MRRFSFRLSVILAFSFAGAVIPHFGVPQVYAASEDMVQQASKRLGFDQAYLTTLDGLISETQKLGMWSGTRNKDTEELRIRLTRERLIARQQEVLNGARQGIADTLSDEELTHLMANLTREDGQIDDVKASETREMVVKLYRDAIFNAIMASAVPVQEQADEMVKSGEATK